MARASAAPDRGLPRRESRFAALGSGKRIGLLGGSFNPAHRGHVHISREALRRLKLDQVWWLVSPQNPLKPVRGMAPFADRLASARRVLAGWRRIRASGLESALGTTYTAETLAWLKRRFPKRRFVWLMGADNLVQIARWRGWSSIFRMVPVAVFARPSYSFKALAATAARRFAAARVPESRARAVAGMAPPAWVFLHCRPDPTSATEIRAERASKGAAARKKTATLGTRSRPAAAAGKGKTRKGPRRR